MNVEHKFMDFCDLSTITNCALHDFLQISDEDEIYPNVEPHSFPHRFYLVCINLIQTAKIR